MSPIRYMLIICFILMLTQAAGTDIFYRAFYETECETGYYRLDMGDYCSENHGLFSVFGINGIYRDFFFFSIIQTILIGICLGSSIERMLANNQGFWSAFLLLMLIPLVALTNNGAFVSHKTLLNGDFNCSYSTDYIFFPECHAISRGLFFQDILWHLSFVINVFVISLAAIWYLHQYRRRQQFSPMPFAYIVNQAFSGIGLIFVFLLAFADTAFLYSLNGSFTLGFGLLFVIPLCIYAFVIYRFWRISVWLAIVVFALCPIAYLWWESSRSNHISFSIPIIPLFLLVYCPYLVFQFTRFDEAHSEKAKRKNLP